MHAASDDTAFAELSYVTEGGISTIAIEHEYNLSGGGGLGGLGGLACGGADGAFVCLLCLCVYEGRLSSDPWLTLFFVVDCATSL